MTSKVLIIDDNAEIRRLIRWSLEDCDVTLQEAPNGTLGLSMAQTLRPDLVFLDVMMPGEIDGVQTCQRLRAEPSLAGMLIVMVSADARAKQRALDAGANFFLGKPFSPAKLLELTEVLLRARKAHPVDPQTP
ncbi:response regulator transcription factor [Roseateles koreensis]|uniref:Response regulator n=1 Tax=Roseateles koreensis TaxID=2987526 RepID=A0ABT5KPT6_9BURK|nr:response regulator [Roseateles koreensis]MDC8784935.1 response regulator [Roseateles koreensis]